MNKSHEELCEEVQQLRQGIRQMATALEGGEWADLLTADQDLGDLEDAVRSLVEKNNALVETRADRDDLAATLDEIGALSPTDYQDREEMLRALTNILRDVRPGARARAEASALRRYANRLHPDHCCRQYLLEVADHVERQTRGRSSEEGAGSAMDNRMRPPMRTPPPPDRELSEIAQVETRIVQAIEEVLGITADELEPPILKDHGDVEHARKMDRRVLEEQYALARMTARLATFHLKRAQAEKAGGGE